MRVESLKCSKGHLLPRGLRTKAQSPIVNRDQRCGNSSVQFETMMVSVLYSFSSPLYSHQYPPPSHSHRTS